MTIDADAVVEAGVFSTTPTGWEIVSRRKFSDEGLAIRWIRTHTSSWQKRNPLARVRGSIVKIGDFLTLEMVLAGYEERRMEGDSEFNDRGLIKTIATGRTTDSPSYTKRQGQFLAFIFYYAKLNGQPPAERDMEHHFKISPTSVHQMILTLEKCGFIERTPGVARSIRLLLRREELPDLD